MGLTPRKWRDVSIQCILGAWYWWFSTTCSSLYL